MSTHGQSTAEPRLVFRAFMARLLRIALGVFAVGLFGFVAVATFASSALHVAPRTAAQLQTVFSGLCVVGLLCTVVAWFEFRSTQTERSFVTQRLSSRHRLVAWSFVATLLAMASFLLWFTISRGPGAW